MSLNQQQMQDLAAVGAEMARLANRKMTKQDENRFGFLKMAHVAIRDGLTLEELEHGQLRARAAKVMNVESVSDSRAWKQFLEQRDMTEGAPMLTHIGTYTGLGYFVPTGFFPKLFAALSQHDCLFNEQDVTLIKTSHGDPIAVPTVGDIENVATVVGEASQTTSVDLSDPGTAKLGAYKYTTWDAVSLEAFDDIEGALSAVSIFDSNFASRFARGIGKDLVTGSGSGKTLGLIPSLLAANVPTVVMDATNVNDGTSSGATTLDTAAFGSALQQLDDAYANSPRCAWIMNKKTLATVASQLDKQGRLVDLVKYVDGRPFIHGIPVKIAPSMDNLGSAKNPVVLGDLSFWATRLATGEESGIQVIKEATGLIEYGKVALRAFLRADGALLYNDSSSPAPFIIIQNHS